MPNNARNVLALDVGERRIGVAFGDTDIRLASPRATILVDGHEIERISALVADLEVNEIVVGYPRNLSGVQTAQTEYIHLFSRRLEPLQLPIIFQDESLTSVMAEEQLKAHGKKYTKEDIDAYAAAIILNDYLETTHAAGL